MHNKFKNIEYLNTNQLFETFLFQTEFKIIDYSKLKIMYCNCVQLKSYKLHINNNEDQLVSSYILSFKFY